MESNTVDKYFKQKNWTAFEIICLVIAGMSAIVSIFVWGGGPIGLPLVVVSVFALVIYRSIKIKDEDIDDLINKIVTDNINLADEKNVMKAFDFRDGSVKKGKDGKLRGTSSVISIFAFGFKVTEITTYRLNLITADIEKNFYSIPKEDNFSLIEDFIEISGAKKTVQYIENKETALIIPVITNDVESFRIVEKLCEKRG